MMMLVMVIIMLIMMTMAMPAMVVLAAAGAVMMAPWMKHGGQVVRWVQEYFELQVYRSGEKKKDPAANGWRRWPASWMAAPRRGGQGRPWLEGWRGGWADGWMSRCVCARVVVHCSMATRAVPRQRG